MILSYWLWEESTITDLTSEKGACEVFKGISPPFFHVFSLTHLSIASAGVTPSSTPGRPRGFDRFVFAGGGEFDLEIDAGLGTLTSVSTVIAHILLTNSNRRSRANMPCVPWQRPRMRLIDRPDDFPGCSRVGF